MNPNQVQATAPWIPFSKGLQGATLAFPARFCLILACLLGPAHALYTAEAVTAYRVPDGKIIVDGKPEFAWKVVAARSQTISTLSFTDYSKMVILQPEKARNDDPSKYVTEPPPGSISMLAAYDNTALYFLFLVKTQSVFNPKTLCSPSDTNLWKADAPEVYLDPTGWKEDSTSYRSFFSTDAGGLVFGTSPKTVQLDKPLNDKDTRFFFRNRATADNFQVPASRPAGVNAVSLHHSATDTGTVLVEMKIPYWGGLTAPSSAAKSMFISWGFNLYPTSLWASCNSNPIAYRWAKHYLNYDNAAVQPPGWRLKDSTHYDPTRSWDGWGRFTMSGSPAVDTAKCGALDPNDWEFTDWRSSCNGNPTTNVALAPAAAKSFWSGSAWRSGSPVRDALGRTARNGATLFILPWEASEATAQAIAE